MSIITQRNNRHIHAYPDIYRGTYLLSFPRKHINSQHHSQKQILIHTKRKIACNNKQRDTHSPNRHTKVQSSTSPAILANCKEYELANFAINALPRSFCAINYCCERPCRARYLVFLTFFITFSYSYPFHLFNIYHYHYISKCFIMYYFVLLNNSIYSAT